jgi:uncharacterized protein with PQ loop repeat
VFDALPILAAAFGIPQYLPQLLRLRRTHDTTGVSWAWATLTSLNNGAWFVYFTLSAYWTAMVPSFAASFLAGVLAVLLTQSGHATVRAAAVVAAWATLLGASLAVAGRAGLGTLLTVAFAIQVAPSLWTAYRVRNPTGISRGTWLLVLGEVSCWAVYGFYRSDPRVIAVGLTGVVASVLILARVHRGPAPVEVTAGPTRPRR